MEGSGETSLKVKSSMPGFSNRTGSDSNIYYPQICEGGSDFFRHLAPSTPHPFLPPSLKKLNSNTTCRYGCTLKVLQLSDTSSVIKTRDARLLFTLITVEDAHSPSLRPLSAVSGVRLLHLNSRRCLISFRCGNLINFRTQFVLQTWSPSNQWEAMGDAVYHVKMERKQL